MKLYNRADGWDFLKASTTNCWKWSNSPFRCYNSMGTEVLGKCWAFTVFTGVSHSVFHPGRWSSHHQVHNQQRCWCHSQGRQSQHSFAPPYLLHLVSHLLLLPSWPHKLYVHNGKWAGSTGKLTPPQKNKKKNRQYCRFNGSCIFLLCSVSSSNELIDLMDLNFLQNPTLVHHLKLSLCKLSVLFYKNQGRTPWPCKAFVNVHEHAGLLCSSLQSWLNLFSAALTQHTVCMQPHTEDDSKRMTHEAEWRSSHAPLPSLPAISHRLSWK